MGAAWASVEQWNTTRPWAGQQRQAGRCLSYSLLLLMVSAWQGLLAGTARDLDSGPTPLTIAVAWEA
jgi:hypothetical protein